MQKRWRNNRKKKLTEQQDEWTQLQDQYFIKIYIIDVEMNVADS